MAGYSGTPLPRKLEIKDQTRVSTVGAPRGFGVLLGALPPGAKVRRGLDGPCDLTIWFVTSRRQLEGDLPRVMPRKGQGSLWIAWPKKSSGVTTDLTENILREVILPLGLVDRKVCAIDDTWSGLLFSWRRTQGKGEGGREKGEGRREKGEGRRGKDDGLRMRARST